MATAPKRKSTSLGAPCVYVLLAGLPGTGKSTLAAALSHQLCARHIRTVILNKDEVRSALFPGSATDYSAAQNDLCMEAMLKSADYLRVTAPIPAFIFFDGRTFSHSTQIEQVIAEAGKQWSILHLVCGDDVVRQRLADSSLTHPAADRTFALYSALSKSFQPITRSHLVIDTAVPLPSCVEMALGYLRAPA